MRDYDFVIFGASGFTGQYVVRNLAEALRDEPSKYNWAIAGRSESKLENILEKTRNEMGGGSEVLKKVGILCCDVSDRESSSLESVTSRTRVIFNCVGPYRFYGEEVVAASIRTRTHYFDISGEPEFLEKMQLKYDEEARENGVYVIGSCGFDSIPADLGQIFLAQNMVGDVNEIETFLEVSVPPDVEGPVINFGTYQSAIYGFANANELRHIRKKLFPERLPPQKPKLILHTGLHRSSVVNGICIPFPGSDRSVMMRTQRLLYGEREHNHRPTQIACYAKLSSWFSAIKLVIMGLIFGFLAKYHWGRSLLERFPGLFSFGTVSKQGPSREMAENTNFKLLLVGRGWNDKIKDRSDKPTREVRITVSGKNIGYGATCDLLVQSGFTLLEELDRIPGQGGVLTPGYAFGDTTLVERLRNHGVPFVVESIKDI